MRFVCTSKTPFMKAAMAHMFLQRMYEEKRLNEICNMDEVLDALDPSKLLDYFAEWIKSDVEKA